MAYKPLDHHKHGEPIILNDARWFVNNRGYYMDRKGRLLHRVVWEATHGPIPEGYVIHHKDGNRLNYNVANLELMSRGKHDNHHPRHRWTESERERQSEQLKERWANPKSHAVKCVGCGTEFQAIGMRAMFCSSKCRRRYYLKYRGY